MSGGSMDYLCYKVWDVAHDLMGSTDPMRALFGLHLDKVANALHEIEWVDSGDKIPGDDGAAIRAALQINTDLGSVLAAKLRRMADALEVAT